MEKPVLAPLSRERDDPTQQRRSLAAVAAEAIAAQIVEQGSPKGALLGTVPELMVRYAVGQSTIVEACRQLERQGVAVLRRGVGGGLVVAGSPRSRVVRTICTYLELLPVSHSEQLEAWSAIVTQAAALAARNVSDAQIATLRNVARELGEAPSADRPLQALRLYIAIADATGNEATALFIRVLTRLYRRSILEPLAQRGMTMSAAAGVELYSALAEAIASGEESVAQQLIRTELARLEQHIGEPVRPSRDHHMNGARRGENESRRPDDDKMGELIALAIRDDILRMGWPVGEKFGDEAELSRRYGASARAIREAVRILELHGVIVPRRGRNGGLFIGVPDPRYTITNASSFLHYTSIPPLSMFEVWREVLLSATKMSAYFPDAAFIRKLREIVGREKTANSVEIRSSAIEFYNTISNNCGNRVISILVDIGSSFIEGYPWSPPSGPAIRQTIEYHEAVAGAIALSDASVARHQMMRFMNEMKDYYYG